MKKLFVIIILHMFFCINLQNVKAQIDGKILVKNAIVAYDLYKSAQVLEESLNDYNEPDANPLAASVVRSSFDDVVNSFYASYKINRKMGIDVHYMTTAGSQQAQYSATQYNLAYEQALIKKAEAEAANNLQLAAIAEIEANAYSQAYITAMTAYETYKTIAASANELTTGLAEGINQISLLQSISMGAANAGLSSSSKMSFVANTVSNVGAQTFAALFNDKLDLYNLKDIEIKKQIYGIVYNYAREASYNAIYDEFSISASNSESCQTAAGVIANVCIASSGALLIAINKLNSEGSPLISTFSSSLQAILQSSSNNPLNLNEQQLIYAEIYAPVFAASFASLVNSSAADVIKAKADTIIENAYKVANGIAGMILESTEASIEDAYCYAVVLNSNLSSDHDVNKNKKIDLNDIIFQLQIMSKMKNLTK